MNSEKVKEIKKALEEEPFNTIKHHKKEGGWIVLSFQEILNLINELENENDEQYKRIMELEQDLIHADEKVFYRECNVTLRENEIKEQAIKQFAERLKEKCEYNRKEYCCEATVSANDIDETLKEFIK